MASLEVMYEQARASTGIDWVRIESQARAAGITDFNSVAYFTYANERYVPMLAALMDRYLALYDDIDTGTAEEMTVEQTRDALSQMQKAMSRASDAVERAMAEGRRLLGYADAPAVSGLALARYVNALSVLAIDGDYRHGVQMRGAVAAGAVSVRQALEDADNVALTLQALIELRRSGTLDLFAARPGASLGAAPVIGLGAAVVIAIAWVLVAFLVTASLLAGFAMALVARLVDKYCFDPETGRPTMHQGRPMPGCEELPGILPRIYEAFLKPGTDLAEKVGWAVIVVGALWAGSKFLLPALTEERRKSRALAPAV